MAMELEPVVISIEPGHSRTGAGRQDLVGTGCLVAEASMDLTIWIRGIVHCVQ